MIKPVAWKREKLFNGSPEYYGKEKLWKDDTPLYAIPDTHCIMPVRLTDKMIEAALPALMREGEDKHRALGQLICVWDALIDAAKEEGK